MIATPLTPYDAETCFLGDVHIRLSLGQFLDSADSRPEAWAAEGKSLMSFGRPER